MEKLQDLAIVLKWVPYEERHRVVTALTENYGRISALARNSIHSRRFGGSLEPFSASLWTFVERKNADLYRVEEAEIRRGYEGLRENFECLALASTFNELMLRLAPERESSPELFKLHANALATLDELHEKGSDLTILLKLLNAYLIKVLQWSGNQPQIHKCVLCSKPLEEFAPNTQMSCRVSDASWFCPAHSAHPVQDQHATGHQMHLKNRFFKLTVAALRDFYMDLSKPIKQVIESNRASDEDHRALFLFLESLFLFHVPGFDQKPLKAIRFLGV